ncbi:hypothetical protein [Acinetobacter indicus]|uniref:hypothetical protein n=1 Tax=Acinetobacter indicus TaxID=756892 RepID=UPI003989156F
MGFYAIQQNFSNVQEYAEQELKISEANGILLDRAYHGNTVYSLVQIKKDGSKLILVDLVRKGSDGFWGHKPLSESVGPYELDCPERILKQSTCQSPLAVAWREKCRQKRRDKAETIKTFKLLPTGIVITTEYGRKLKFMRAYNKSWSQIVCLDIEDNQVYRYSYKSFKADELKQALEELKAA